MAKRASLAVCVTLVAGFIVGVGCSSIPDHRKAISGSENDGGGGDGGGSVDGGSGATGNGGSPNGGRSGSGNGGAGGTAGSGATSSGGRAGGNGAGGRAGAAGGGPNVDGGVDGGVVGIPCGSNNCVDRTVGRTTYPACCAGPSKDRCGLDTTVNDGLGCVEPAQAGAADTICKDLSLDDGTTFTGCCRPDGKCGVFYELVNGPHLGCIDPTEIGLPAGKDCTPAPCTAQGATCQQNSDCCPGPAGDPVCAQLTSGGATGATCTDYCVTNGDCASGCCVLLISGKGACAPAASCAGTCRKIDDTCDSDADCCTGVCSPNSDSGPRLCRPKCTTNAQCDTGHFCVKDEAGRGACSTDGAGLCSDTCYLAGNGSCEDSGDASASSYCALGSDCSDCGGTAKAARLGGTIKAFDTCSTHTNGKCEDGGPHSSASTCAFGTDYTDCGPRLGICANTCQYAYDGSCDDGGPGAGYADCGLGTDCADCGVRIGGRGQGVCDGTNGTICQPHGAVLDYGYEVEDGTCQCPDCPWDAVDCKVTKSKCDGVTLGICCAPNNPCKIQYDGICSCGGWCDWETPDCGRVTKTPYCDGSSEVPAGCTYPMPASSPLKGNAKCDCAGACSWEQAECMALGTLCTDSCKTANNGTCDDDDVKCGYGTDCVDCGPRYPH